MTLTATEMIYNKANDALNKVAARVADMIFFEQIERRIKAGDELKEELKELKKLTKDEALQAVRKLLKRCNDDLQSNEYWRFGDGKTIAVKVKMQMELHELIARFEVTYTMKTKLANAVATVNTAGKNITVAIDYGKLTKEQKIEAEKSITRLLLAQTFAS